MREVAIYVQLHSKKGKSDAKFKSCSMSCNCKYKQGAVVILTTDNQFHTKTS